MIFLFTDFGLCGPYLGQVRAVLWQAAPAVPVIDLFADAPDRRPKEAAYLLAAYLRGLPPDACVFCVVDPGVGGDRPPLALRLDGRWLVGPGNGLMEIALRQAASVESYIIDWRPKRLAPSFHGRDLFAPILGRLAAGMTPVEAGLRSAPPPRMPDWPDDLPSVVYRDVYGNLMTGMRSACMTRSQKILVSGQLLSSAGTFGEVAAGRGFFYGNANGLVEIAVSQGSAGDQFGLGIGSPIKII